MPTGISDALLTELQIGRTVAPVLELSDGDTTLKFADEAVVSRSRGQYQKRIIAGGWGNIVRSANSRNNTLQSAETSVALFDHDHVLGKWFAGPRGGTFVDLDANILLVSDHVDADDHYEIFDGVVSDYRGPGDLLYRLTLSPKNEQVLRNENILPEITAPDFPNAPTAVLGLPAQAVYGKYNSQGVFDAAGMIPTICVDSGNSWFLVAFGRLMKATLKVWKNGNDDTNNWVIEWKTQNGRHYTIVRDITSTANSADTVQVDLWGYESNGDGSSGTIISEGSDQIVHFLTNFVFGNYPNGSTSLYGWLSSAGKPINISYFAETGTFLSERDHEASRVIHSEVKGIKTLEEWCKSFNLTPFWSWDWKIGVRPNDHTKLDLGGTVHVRQEHALGPLTWKPQIRGQKNMINVNFLLNEAAGEFAENHRLCDSRRSPLLKETKSFEWGRSELH